jgi:hypothetical protein
MLSHVCRLEDMDPFLLLPLTQPHLFDEKVRQAGGFPDQKMIFMYDQQISEPRKSIPRSIQSFPAIVSVLRTSTMNITASETWQNPIESESILAGELHVGSHGPPYPHNIYVADLMVHRCPSC